MTDNFLLDLNRATLLGWHDVNDRVVEAIVEGIKWGDEFPEVVLEKVGEDTYRLLPLPHALPLDDLDGGHHRAVGHYKSGIPLRCRFPTPEEEPLTFDPPLFYRPIAELRLVNDRTTMKDGMTEYERRWAAGTRYRWADPLSP